MDLSNSSKERYPSSSVSKGLNFPGSRWTIPICNLSESRPYKRSHLHVPWPHSAAALLKGIHSRKRLLRDHLPMHLVHSQALDPGNPGSHPYLRPMGNPKYLPQSHRVYPDNGQKHPSTKSPSSSSKNRGSNSTSAYNRSTVLVVGSEKRSK